MTTRRPTTDQDATTPVEPEFMQKTAPSGARSGDHTQLSTGQKAVNTSISQMRAPGERANAELKSWRILRKIRFSSAHATILVNAVQALIFNH